MGTTIRHVIPSMRLERLFLSLGFFSRELSLAYRITDYIDNLELGGVKPKPS